MEISFGKIIKWAIYLLVIFAAGFAITFATIFSSFEDVESNAASACNQFQLEENYAVALVKARNIDLNLSIPEGEVRQEIDLLFTGGFLSIGGCTLYFENDRLVNKKVWVD